MKRWSLPLVALMFVTGCSAAGQPAPKPTGKSMPPRLCTSGQATFGTASTSGLLTGVTPVLDATAPGMTLDQPYAQIGTRTAGVRAGTAVPGEQVYQQLAAAYAQTRPLVDYGTVHHPATGDRATFDGVGRFVEYEWIRAVDVPFTYACGGATSAGTVTSWEAAGRGGVLDCDEPDGKAPADEAAILGRVRRLRCSGTAQDPATK